MPRDNAESPPIETTFTGSSSLPALIELAQSAVEPRELARDLTAVLVPDGFTLEQIDTQDREPFPYRATGVSRPATVDAFIAHVERHIDERHTTIWVHPTSGVAIAVFNDHATPTPASGGQQTGWGDHRSVLRLQHTPEWVHWASRDNQLVDQTTFAEHLEDGLREIVEPAAADLLEMAQTFHAVQNATFRQAGRLRDGALQLHYHETIDATAGQEGEVAIPQTFTLLVAPFIGEQPVELSARLRYRLQSGKLRLGYKLDHPDLIIRETLTAIADRLAEKFADVFIGEPAGS